MSQPESENEDTPCWTEDELQQVAKQRDFLEQVTNALMFAEDKRRINADMPLTEIKAEPLYFHQSVLDKYKNNPYCDIGNEADTGDQSVYGYIQFLSKDKEYDSRLRFVNVQDMLKVEAKDYINIPPRQRGHWSEHQMLQSSSE